jgi:hypothetical protein
MAFKKSSHVEENTHAKEKHLSHVCRKDDMGVVITDHEKESKQTNKQTNKQAKKENNNTTIIPVSDCRSFCFLQKEEELRYYSGV